ATRLGQTIVFRLLGCEVRVACTSGGVAALLARCFGQTGVAPGLGHGDLEYVVREETGGFVLERAGREPIRAEDEGELLFELELTLALQRLRRDLYFLHAAALATSAGAVVVAGASGAGKSTLAWGLVHHGFRCLSDELAPVDLGRLEVLAYPRALCIKGLPPR